MKRIKKKQANPKKKAHDKASSKRQDPSAEEMKDLIRASIPFETPFIIPAELAPADLRVYVNEALARAQKTVEVAVLNLANLLTQPLTPLEYARVRDYAKTAKENIIDPLEDRARQFVVDVLLSKGKKILKDGTIAGREPLQIEEAGYVVRMRPYRNTFDDKKYEPMMREKGLDPELGASKLIIFKPSAQKINALVEKGVLTAEEREAMRHKLTWTVERPRTLEEMQKALEAGSDEGAD